jgi:GT2 family glycosyltransferase
VSAGLKFRFVCASRKSTEEFHRTTALGRSLALYPYPFVDLRLFPSNTVGLPTLYNTALREAENDPAILIFMHDDVFLCDFFWPKQISAALTSFDIVGVAGNKRRLPNQPSWFFTDRQFNKDTWENYSGFVAHGQSFPPDNISFYGPPCQRVKLLDGLMLIAKSETLLAKQISFDERFDFHFYDLDFCRQAELQQLRMGTWNISVIHQSGGAFGTASWNAAYSRYLEKWKS